MENVVHAQDAGDDGLTEAEMRQNLLTLAFDGDEKKLQEFCDLIRVAVPADTTAVLRGSAVTGERHKDGAPFDADGPGTSDLDLTLVGDDILSFFDLTGSYVPGVHTKPMGEDNPDIAPGLRPLREKLSAMVGRPVNIQASRDFWQQIRGDLMGEPYLTLFGSVGG